jgi:hydroxyacylglutathione hydrolase
LVLVDAGLPGEERAILRRIRAAGGGHLRLIVITHAHLDHYGSAAALRRLTGAPIAIHRADGEALARGETPLGSARSWGKVVQVLLPLFERVLRPEPTSADLRMEEGDSLEQFGLEATVVHIPGHTPGSICLVVEGQFGFVGDLVSTNGRPHVQHLYAQDWSLLQESLHRLRGLGLVRLYPGHGRRWLDGQALARLLGKEG